MDYPMPVRTYYTPTVVFPGDIDSRTDILSDSAEMSKGFTPPPLEITSDPDLGAVKIRFKSGDFVKLCNGNVQCLAQSLDILDGSTELGKLRKDNDKFEVVLSGQVFSNGTPLAYTFTFEDAAGNQTNLTGYVITAVVPKKPIAMSTASDADDRRSHILVGAPIYSETSTDLRSIVTQYQIERYVRNPTNSNIWVDWVDIGSSGPSLLSYKDRVHWDRDVLSEVEHGYRIRFRVSPDNVSQWSDWALV